MDVNIVAGVVDVLRAEGYRACRAWPGTGMPDITDVTAAVSLYAARFREGTTAVRVTVLVPGKLGAECCESAAWDIGEILEAEGAECSVADCEFDGKTGRFSAPVTAVFRETAPETIVMKIGAVVLGHAVNFTAQRAVSKTVTSLSNANWHLRLEEFFPAGEAEELTPAEPFTVTNGKELYQNCTLTSQKRVREANGTRQIRECVATSMIYL